MSKLCVEMKKEKLLEVYSMLSDVIGELEESSGFTYIPDTQEDAWKYYDQRLRKIRGEIDRLFLWDKEIRNKLYLLVEETEYLIKSCSIPGAPKRWLDTNPCLNFYDAVYEVVEEYIHAKRYGTSGVYYMPIKCSFYPTAEDCEARREYFNNLQRKNNAYNLQYSEERWLQDELQRTLRMLFEEEFA